MKMSSDDKKIMETAKILEINIPQEQAGMRIDKGLSEGSSLEGMDLSRSRIQRLLQDGMILVNDRPVRPSYRLQAGDVVCVQIPAIRPAAIVPEDIPLDILYEDAHLLIVNKPQGMVVHPAPGHEEHTLVNAVLFHCQGDLSGINGELRPGIVHRIDRDTSGALVVCKDDRTHQDLAAQLKEHTITRVYHAIVQGNVKVDEGRIDASIGRHPTDRKRMSIHSRSGRRAVTHYRVLERFGGYTYIQCRLETGRTHQIRVHMASIAHPLLGDSLYNRSKDNPFRLNGQALHAYVLGFKHPHSGEYLEVSAPFPGYFIELLNKLRNR